MRKLENSPNLTAAIIRHCTLQCTGRRNFACAHLERPARARASKRASKARESMALPAGLKFQNARNKSLHCSGQPGNCGFSWNQAPLQEALSSSEEEVRRYRLSLHLLFAALHLDVSIHTR